VLSLAQAGDGAHRNTITVSPDDLGPVTVRAIISGDALRVELAAATDAARDAIRHILTDLRRDLAAAAPHASLSLAAGDAGGGSQAQGQPSPHAGASADSGQSAPRDPSRAGREAEAARRDATPDDQPPAPHPAPTAFAPASFDVFA
jgi:flagellar hook-length control protein FliK